MGPLVKAAIDGAREEGVQIHVHKVPETHISYILSSVLRSSGVIMGIPYSSDPLPSPLAHALDDLGRKRMTGRKFFWFLQAKGLEPEGEQRSEALVEEIDRILEKYQMRWEALESAHIPRHTEEIVYQQSRALAMELVAGGAIKGHVQELVGAP
jgi:flavorubredoxin